MANVGKTAGPYLIDGDEPRDGGGFPRTVRYYVFRRDTRNWWWPRKGFGIYWPPGFDLSDEVSVLVRIFEVHGYSRCADGSREDGYEKVAIYSRDNRFKHAARQLPYGRWASKLGEEQDIEHELAEHLLSRSYGDTILFMRRRRTDWQ